MKHTRLALVFVALAAAATPSVAASLTMLQFGSFETREEAQKRLNEVNKKHASALGKLGSTIREVKLPPDNLTVYRTQAGPVESRAAAQAVCATLASAGDECYIVQTAMVAAADVAKPVAQMAAAIPATPAAPAVSAPVEAAASAAMTDVSTQLAQATPLAKDITSKLSSINEPTVRDASNVKALESIQTPKLFDTPAIQTAVTPTVAEPSKEMKAALDKAVSEQAAAEASVHTATNSVGAKPGATSIWSRLNPFGTTDAAKPAAAVEQKTPPFAAVSAVPATPPASTNVEVPATVEAPVMETVKAPVTKTIEPLPEVNAATPAPAVQAELSAMPPISAGATAMDATPVIMQAEPLQLPPPPAPLKARDRELLAAARDSQPGAAPTPTGTLAPIEIKPLPPVDGTVQVEEATRVPVTETNIAPPVVATAQPIVPLKPSSTDGMKTIWAQMGPFKNNDEALAFWVKYREANPDFPVVRVRVTTPMAKHVRGSTESWLRVGPVTRAGFVKNLCTNVFISETDLMCGTVTDSGAASSAKTIPGLLPSSRYNR